LDGEVTTIDDNGQEKIFNNLYRRPKHHFGLTLFYTGVKNLNANLGIRHIGKRSDLFFNPDNFFIAEDVNLKPYVYMHGSLQYTFSKSLSGFIDLKNLTNSDFQEVYGFSTPGLNVSFGLQIDL